MDTYTRGNLHADANGDHRSNTNPNDTPHEHRYSNTTSD
jgi:hypothetical protein